MVRRFLYYKFNDKIFKLWKNKSYTELLGGVE